ncbi:PAS domain-containing sensor histidine kinase [Bdellovibrio sp. SKB1291214]|uniref:sensor histidine kinase n=1 Tax=Bdellovibrio sp. SKB1291214 TaxID=1732569 RepID=UPI000B514E88|nr:PAS domain-containing sensor histidine kinase [Bdellovibrio sp. SKB1291214]UYL09254.1 PAS domain-containing sensor histidine kinase [Bdellovibrio sp. SKB1291214]
MEADKEPSVRSANAAFKSDSNKFNIIVDSVPNGLIVVDQRGEILMCNAEMEKLFGYDKGELLGQSLEILVPREVRSNHVGHRTGFFAHPSKRQMGAGRDLRGIRKDGSEIPVEIGLNPLETEQGNFVVASVVDITERKKMDLMLLRAYDEVQQKNLEMEQFVYTVSHDLKAPLVTSSSYISFLREDLQAGRYNDLIDSLERVEKANKKMHELIYDLLQLSRTSRMELKVASINLTMLINEIKKDLKDQLDDKKTDLIIPADLPVVLGDAKRLTQVFENLVINGLKYAAVGETNTIEIVQNETEKEWNIGVKDNGPGIPPQYHKKIFALFQRLDTQKEGTGVGLTIVSRIMGLHGGRAWVESEPPHGATFWLCFPKQPQFKENRDGIH